jgi:hypothetical protein
MGALAAEANVSSTVTGIRSAEVWPRMPPRTRLLITLVLFTGCTPTVISRPAPAPAELITVRALRNSIQQPDRVWLLVGFAGSHSGLFLDSLPAEELVAVVGRDSVIPMWGPRRLAIRIDRCGWADTLLTHRGRREIYLAAPCPWTRDSVPLSPGASAR